MQVVDYRDVQFTKTEEVLSGMGLDGLEKSESALEELREKGLAVTPPRPFAFRYGSVT